MKRLHYSFRLISFVLGIFLSVFVVSVQNASAEATPQPLSLTGAGNGSAAAPQNSLSTGAATYSIPIEVPPGRLGISPGINVIYNSQAGNSWLGVGWNLDMGSIQRNTKNGLDYGKDDYLFTKDGSSTELIKLSPTGNEYRPKIDDGSFLRFFKSTQNVWSVYDKTGKIYYYGQSTASRLDEEVDPIGWTVLGLN